MYSFAGFVVTYNRPEILKVTIKKIFSQTYPPEKLWVIDNSIDSQSANIIKEFNDPKLSYLRVGYNSGPAHAINLGLEKVASEGYDWCFWGDDDDPPPFSDTFEKLFESLKLIDYSQNVGQIGIVGHRLDFRTGILDQVKNNELEGDGIISVDNIAGGQSKIVKTFLWKSGVKISSKLFYGFEELDFDIQVKKLGFCSIVPKELYRRQRYHPRREEIIREKLTSRESLWRQYYSTRNLLFIFQKHSLYCALSFLLIRKLLKLPFDFLKGWRYGTLSAKYNWLGIFHWFSNKYGKRI